MQTNNRKENNVILITVDLEDWFQVENLRLAYPFCVWDACEIRIERNTRELLDIFDDRGVQATFFVLGWMAERCRGLVKEISERGHEIASHGYKHQLCSALSKEVLREDVCRSKALLEDIVGRPVFGYRAPSFSITEHLVEVLGDAGYFYDSSYNSFALNKRYGRANSLFHSCNSNLMISDNGIIELPVSNLEIGGQTIPWGGGGYFRFWPPRLYSWGVTKILHERKLYLFYCHPWEIDPEQPQARQLGWLGRFRHYVNLDKTLKRLEQFLERFHQNSFISCQNYLRCQDAIPTESFNQVAGFLTH
ncbi:MAG TPA: polysaccharide deacetylase [Thermoplasmata archaeon]|nr:MAG TPA: polysaccharide deacetylase [Thermoplasmata archaeon]